MERSEFTIIKPDNWSRGDLNTNRLIGAVTAPTPKLRLQSLVSILENPLSSGRESYLVDPATIAGAWGVVEPQEPFRHRLAGTLAELIDRLPEQKGLKITYDWEAVVINALMIADTLNQPDVLEDPLERLTKEKRLPDVTYTGFSYQDCLNKALVAIRKQKDAQRAKEGKFPFGKRGIFKIVNFKKYGVWDEADLSNMKGAVTEKDPEERAFSLVKVLRTPVYPEERSSFVHTDKDFSNLCSMVEPQELFRPMLAIILSREIDRISYSRIPEVTTINALRMAASLGPYEVLVDSLDRQFREERLVDITPWGFSYLECLRRAMTACQIDQRWRKVWEYIAENDSHRYLPGGRSEGLEGLKHMPEPV